MPYPDANEFVEAASLPDPFHERRAIDAANTPPIRRPVLIRHCVNDRRRLDVTGPDGATAVELDVRWHHGALSVQHPAPSPPACWGRVSRGPKVGALFAALAGRLRATDASKLEFAILDIKGLDSLQALEAAGRPYAAALARALTETGVPPDRVIVAIPAATASRFHTLLGEAGLQGTHLDAWQGLGVSASSNDWLDTSIQAGGCFLGVGADPAAWWRPNRTWRRALALAIHARDTTGNPHDVYYWTVERRRSLEFAIGLGIDAVIVNHPRRFIPILTKNDGMVPPSDPR